MKILRLLYHNFQLFHYTALISGCIDSHLIEKYDKRINHHRSKLFELMDRQ